MKLFHDIYKGKRVLITGHTGFKGSWLSVWLSELGADIIGYALKPSTTPNLFEISSISKKITSILGDIRDLEKLKSIFKKHKPEIVFHLAAQSLVRYSYREPVVTFETNVMGTINLLEACRHSPSVRVIINVTSDKCYENKGWIWGYRENDPMGGYDPYSSSKGCTELITNAYRNAFFNLQEYGKTHNIALSSVRAGNIIGGGDWAEDRLIPDCVKALSKNKKIAIRNPKSTRPWQYVLDPLAGYLLLGASMYKDAVKYSGPWNFGPSDDSLLTVKEIVKLVIKHWGNGDFIIEKLRHEKLRQPHEAKLLKLDASKAYTLLGWKPIYNIYEAVKRTIHWYKEFYYGKRREKDIYDSMVGEIMGYSTRLKKK